MSYCIFCTLIADPPISVVEIPGIKHFVLNWDIYPITAGHVEIVVKRHVGYYQDLNQAELDELNPAIAAVYDLLEKTNLAELYQSIIDETGDDNDLIVGARDQYARLNRPPDGHNHGLNDGPAAGQTVPHFHYHIIPRWEGDIENPQGGIRRLFPEKRDWRKFVK